MSIGITGFFGFNKSQKEKIVLDYGRWVMVNTTQDGRVAWSNDGYTWTEQFMGIFRALSNVDFSFEQGLYVAGEFLNRTTNIITSTNSVTWTLRSKPNTDTIIGVKWCSAFNKWIANGGSSLFESTDGITWTILYNYPTNKNSGTYDSLYEDDINGGPLYATVLKPITGGGTISTLWTTDGQNFTESDILPSDTYFSATSGRNLIYHPIQKRFLITNQLTYTTEIWPQILPYSSSISSGWATQSFQPSFGTPQWFIGAAYGNGLFVVCGFSGGNQNQPIHYSSTGLPGSWTSSVFPFSFNYRFVDVEWSEGLNRFVVISQIANNLYTSENGMTWTLRTFSLSSYQHISWGQGVRTTGFRQGPDIT